MIADVFATPLASTRLFDGGHPRDPGVARLFRLGRQTTSGARVTTKTVLGYSPVFRAVNIVSNGVAKCKPHIYQRLGDDQRPDPHGRGKRRATEHPAWRVTVKRANQFMSAREFRKLLTIYAILNGNGVAYITRDIAGRAVEMTPLLPDRTGLAIFTTRINADSPCPREEQQAEVLYWTMVGGQMRTMLPENILHIRGTSWNGVWGLDLVELMSDTFGLGLAALECSCRIYGQGMLQSGILYMPSGYSGSGPKKEEAQTNFVKAITEQAQGLGKSHRLLVIEEGAKYEALSIDPEKAQALEGREFNIREVANVIGCQAYKLGDRTRTSYNSIEASRQDQLDDDIDPWLCTWEETLDEAVLLGPEQDTGSHYVECNRKALLQTDLKARSEFYVKGRQNGFLNGNEIRKAEGLDPMGPEGENFWMPKNMQPADQAAAAVAGTNAEARGAAAVLADDYRALAMHEVERLATRTCNEAIRKAGQGGEQFVTFLDSIQAWCQDPSPLKSLLEMLGAQMASAFDAYTHPPYAAQDLRSNVAAGAQQILEATVEHARQHLEKT